LYCAHCHPELVKTLVLCEPSVLQLLANSRDDDVQLFQSYKDNSKSAHEAFRNGDNEKAVRIVLDVALGMQNVFDHIPEQTRMVLMYNVKGVQQELESEITL